MDIRICRICGYEKLITEYHKTKKGVQGRDSRCKECKNRIKRERDASKEGKEKNSLYCTSDEYKKRRHSLRMENGGRYKIVEKFLKKIEDKKRAGSKYISKEEAIEWGLTRYFEGYVCNRGHVSERSTANSQCADCSIINAAKPDRLKKKKEYYKDNRERLLSRNIERQRERYAESAEYKAGTAARNMLKRVLRQGNKKKHGGSYEMLGYTRDELMQMLESKFTDGMTWDNYGRWHIDHIIPVSWFINNGTTDPATINALTNLQPLWAADNFAKRDYVDLKAM
jgi:hypothetical protein